MNQLGIPQLDEVIRCFTDKHGEVAENAFHEIVFTEPLITVHFIPATDGRNHVTLFTTGMSLQPMTVPDGLEDFAYAELFIQLPATWDLSLTGLNAPENRWPIEWLRNLAQFPHQQQTCIGGPVAIFANESAEDTFSSNHKFAGMFVFAEDELVRQFDGRTVQFYRLTPLYWEEILLEREQGIPGLMNAFDEHSIPFVVNVNRRNVAV